MKKILVLMAFLFVASCGGSDSDCLRDVRWAQRSDCYGCHETRYVPYEPGLIARPMEER